MTPGRLQYYKAENEPFIPENIKWAIRMPERYAISELNRDYLPQIQQLIHEHVQSHFKYDITNGGQIDIDKMTMGELKAIFEKMNDKVKQMQESGELDTFLSEYSANKNAFTTGEVKIMADLDQAISQIAQAESEIYDSLRESDGRIQQVDGAGIVGLVSGNIGDVTLNNLQLADAMGESSRDHAILARQLHHLLGARIAATEAKLALLEHSSAFEQEDDDLEDRINTTQTQLKIYNKAFGDDMAALSGDGKLIKEQVDLVVSEQMS
jgi:hypothetical protein